MYEMYIISDGTVMISLFSILYLFLFVVYIILNGVNIYTRCVLMNDAYSTYIIYITSLTFNIYYFSMKNNLYCQSLINK